MPTSRTIGEHDELRRMGGGSTSSIPADLAHDIARRVAIAAGVMATVWVIVAIMATITRRLIGDDPVIHYAWSRFGNLLTASQVVLAGIVAWAARRYRSRPSLVLAVGLAHEVAIAAGIALVSQWNPPMYGRGISWICMLILAYPAIVPARPRTTFAVALVAGAMDPIFHVLAVRSGVTPPMPGFMAAWSFVPNLICAGLAIIPSSIVRQLGRAVREARELGNYRLEERLGAGGMGEVFRASHRLLARPAAVKLIAAGQLGARNTAGRSLVVERFRREAEAAAKLRSPHTIELYDFGVSNDGDLFYAMELLDGIDLHTLVKEQGPQPAGRVIHLLRQACLSLAEAHRKGLVHRDIKPSNLMICRMGTEVDFLKVLDFGLVKVEAAGDAALTAPDVTAGTPAYMAPEAIDGVHELDARADLYALGCVAYWLLTGREVFEGGSALAVLIKHGREPPPPMSRPGIDIPPDLEAIVLRCLEKSPERRPADALALERALARCADAGAWTSDDAARWWAIHLPEGAGVRAGAPAPAGSSLAGGASERVASVPPIEARS